MNSIVCAVKNRLDNLSTALCSWIYTKDVDEIILVDWSSDVKININHPKIKVIRVDDKPLWCLSHAYNLAIAQSQGDIIFKVDADYVLHPEYIIQHPPIENTAYCGWKTINTIQLLPTQRCICGSLIISREAFNRVGGYNEYIDSYGNDDLDIYYRLSIMKIELIPIKPEYIWHLYHNDSSRSQFTKITPESKMPYSPTLYPEWGPHRKKWFE